MREDPEAASLCAALAADLAGLTVADAQPWGSVADQALVAGLREPALRALGDRRDRAAVYGRLFLLGVSQSAADVDAAFPRVRAAGLARLGLVQAKAEPGEASIRPLARLAPQEFADERGEGTWWIASDLDQAAVAGALPPDHVLGVGGASMTLAGLQLPTRAARVWDVGTGSGIQALRAARYADQVVATDVSVRALRYAHLNLCLAGAARVQLRHGSLWDPVRGEQFDRVISNPPFVITPRAAGVPRYQYRDGGAVGDDLVAEFITNVGRYLRPGGVAQLLGNWESRAGAPGLDRVRAWVQASAVPLDAWVIEREVAGPLEYAQLWVSDGGTEPGAAGYAELIDAWLADFAAREVSEIGFGYVLLRRPSDGRLRLDRYERATGQVSAPGALGAHLAAALAAHDRVAGLDDEQLAAKQLVVAADVTEARHHVPGAEAPSVIEIRQGGGLGRVITVSPATAALVGACDGDLPLGALVDAIAQLLEADAAALRREQLPIVRELLISGVLRFA